MPSQKTNGTTQILGGAPPRASQLIVTIYGDIVEPRSGVLWMGDLISLCEGFDVNESLVRTAVSRLVSKGQIVGRRQGRRSFYALTQTASAEYHAAADLFFGPLDDECGWIILHCRKQQQQLELAANGFAALGGDMFLGADRPGRPKAGVAFRSEPFQPDSPELKQLISEVFDLTELSQAYSVFAERLKAVIGEVEKITDGQTALHLRLALIHAYRSIRFKDPRLPLSALPSDWSGHDAHRLFAEAYCALSVPADAYIGEHLLDDKGRLPSQSKAISDRLSSLSGRL